MAWTRELAGGLRISAEKVKNEDLFDWCDVARCNCGILVQTLCGMDPGSVLLAMRSTGIPWWGSWSMVTEEIKKLKCSKTGFSLPLIFERLMEEGLSLDDIFNLEVLGDAEICSRAGIDLGAMGDKYDEPELVHRYMLAWADMIEEQLGPREPVPVETVPKRTLVKGRTE